MYCIDTDIPPGIWSAQDDMYIDITYACTVQMQTYPPDQLDSGMWYQLLLWDEVYRLWYFNDNITTLVVSEKLLYDIYWRFTRRQTKISHLFCNRYIYTAMETSGMVNLWNNIIHLCTHEQICIYPLQDNSLNTIIYT